MVTGRKKKNQHRKEQRKTENKKTAFSTLFALFSLFYYSCFFEAPFG